MENIISIFAIFSGRDNRGGCSEKVQLSLSIVQTQKINPAPKKEHNILNKWQRQKNKIPIQRAEFKYVKPAHLLDN